MRSSASLPLDSCNAHGSHNILASTATRHLITRLPAISGAEYKGRMAHRFQAISETAWSPAQQHYLVCLSLSLSLVCAAQWRLASATLTTQRHAARSARMVRGVCANGLGVPRNLRPLVFVSFGGIGNRQLPAARMTCLGGSFCRAPRAQEKPLASWLSERHVRLR